jgi:C4-dicarboxylate transporter DctQ subunit
MLQIWGYYRALRANSAQPVGIPLIEDAATLAAKEAESVAEQDDTERRD